MAAAHSTPAHKGLPVPLRVEPGQLTLPFLTADDVATIDQAAAAIERATTRAIAARHTAEADELDALGARLLDIITRNAERVRSGR